MVGDMVASYGGRMFPTTSVTLIGLVIGGLWIAFTRERWALLGGLVGAWAGFVVGTLAGVSFDVIFGTGSGVVLAGHALAVVGALVGARSRTWMSGQSATTIVDRSTTR